MKRTYVDASVLIAAARGQAPQHQSAMQIRDDPEREFVSSDFLKLEVLPMAVYHGRVDEVAFYEAFFENVAHWIVTSSAIAEAALSEACTTGIHALDALHIASAVAAEASEFVTAERPAKPIHRTRSVSMLSIHQAAE